MKQVLLVSFFFPPVGSVHGRRIYRFACHLPQFGWAPYLVIPAQQPLSDSETPFPSEVAVSRVPYADWASRLGIWGTQLGGRRVLRILENLPPDPEFAWAGAACRKALQIIRQEKIDVIYTSSFPASVHLIGWWLKQRTGLPWVAEFTDEWVCHPDRAWLYVSQRRRWVEALMERLVVRNAERVVVASPGYVQAFGHHLPPAEWSERFAVITNGYDGDLASAADTTHGNNEFTIVYTGNLYYPSVNPESFLSALARLVTVGAIPADQLRVMFVGQGTEDVIQRYKAGPLGNCVQQTGWVSHVQALAAHREADVLLLILSPERGSATIPGKVFEYLKYGKPILAVVPPGSVVGEIVKDTKTGTCVDSSDVDAISKAIIDLYARWTEGQLKVHPDWDRVRQYDSRELTRKLAILLNEVAGV